MESLPLWIQIGLVFVAPLSAVFAGLGLMLNVRQSRRTNRQARLALVAGFFSDFAQDSDIQNAFYLIEYEKFTYDENFHGSRAERGVDKLLRHMANLALAWESGLLDINDVMPIKYYVRRIMSNKEIQKYIDFLKDWSTRTQIGNHPYISLLKMSEKLQGTK